MSRIKISRVVANVLDNSFLTVLSNNIVATLLTTSNVAEGANLYFSNTRARAAVGAVGSNLTYYEANGNYQVTVPGSNQQVIFNNNGQLGASSGLYYDGVSLKVNGNMESLYSNGSEGGEFFLNKPASGTAITEGVTIDLNGDRLRFFERGGSNRGFYIDITTGGNAAGTNLVGGGGGSVTSVGSYTGAVSNAQLLGAVQSGGTSISFDQIHSSNNSYGTNFKVGDDAWIGDYNSANAIKIKGQQDAANGFISFGSNSFTLGVAGAGELTYGGNKVYHAGNDGAGSGLDADLLDNNNSSYYTLTTNHTEGTNLFFTNTRARAAVGAVGSNLVYYEANGNFQVIVSSSGGGGGAVDSVNGQTGTVVLTTANIAENGNLYYTDNRVWANVGANIGNVNAWADSNSANIGNINSRIRTIPQNIQNASYTIQLSDAAGHILHPSADTTARTWIIPQTGTGIGQVNWPLGTVLTFINQSGAGNISLQVTSDTLSLAVTGQTGTRTLAANGIATCIKITATEWFISGIGIS